MQLHEHALEMTKRRPRRPHRQLRRRVLLALTIVLVVDAVGTVLMSVFESGKPRSEIGNLWDAFFFSTVQLLTISSQMRNPVTTPGRIVDIFLELVGVGFVSAIAGSFASFYLNLGAEES
ncbi:MAG TPA: ion channel [Gaiellaceae bacterium]|nr:ion channel [Gaiellaceae bacterium]